MAVKIEKWVVAQKKHKLSDKHVQMARELGLNPDKLGKIDNHKQELWKAPLPQFIEEIYFKRFKRKGPATVRSLKDIIAGSKVNKEQKKREKEQKRKERSIYATKLEAVIKTMEIVFESVPYGIDHTMKVLDNARQIITEEKTDRLKYGVIIELAAVLHDIGAIEAQKKHGSMEGHFQELEGVPIAAEIMQEQNYEQSIIDRVCYIVGNHHTPENIDDIDFQILWEADLIENMQIMDCIQNEVTLKQFVANNFKTQTGKNIALNRYR